MKIKKRNKLLLKIGIACTAFLAFLTCLVTPTFAYTLSNDYVYSNNGLNIEKPSYCTFDTSNLTNSSITIVSTIDSGSTARPFICDLYDGSTSEVLYTTTIADAQNWQFETINLINGTDLDYLRSNWSNKTIRFIRDGSTRYDYVEYKVSDIIDYYSQFIPLNKIYTYFGVCFKVGWINVAIPGSINLIYVGVYFGDALPTETTYEPYGVYGNTTTNTISVNSYNDGLRDGRAESQATIENLNDDLESKERVIDFLNEENNILTRQLNNVNGSWQSVFFSMVDIPFLTASKVLGFELFGLNLYRAFIGILTVLAIFFVFRKISGK